jgi:hypothetical protein
MIIKRHTTNTAYNEKQTTMDKEQRKNEYYQVNKEKSLKGSLKREKVKKRLISITKTYTTKTIETKFYKLERRKEYVFVDVLAPQQIFRSIKNHSNI